MSINYSWITCDIGSDGHMRLSATEYLGGAHGEFAMNPPLITVFQENLVRIRIIEHTAQDDMTRRRLVNISASLYKIRNWPRVINENRWNAANRRVGHCSIHSTSRIRPMVYV